MLVFINNYKFVFDKYFLDMEMNLKYYIKNTLFWILIKNFSENCLHFNLYSISLFNIEMFMKL